MALFSTHHWVMAHAGFSMAIERPQVVGSFGSPNELRDADAASVREACDIAEIRLDFIPADAATWQHLQEIPLIFTARRMEEGGSRNLNSKERMDLLESVVNQAACIDIEVASISEMNQLLKLIEIRHLPWIASFHDFDRVPSTAALETAAKRAKDAGASVFKVAARVHHPQDVARLADFQLADHGIPVATMGMGSLAPVSRLLCAQCGSVLNYGYLGSTPTAPGQWDAALLKRTIARLTPFRA